MKLINIPRRAKPTASSRWRDRRMSARLDHPDEHVIAGLSREMEKLSAGTDPDIDLDQIDYMFPITSPEKIFCIGRNYRATRSTGRRGLNGPVFSALRVRVAPHSEAYSSPVSSSWITKGGVIRQNRDGTSGREGVGLRCRIHVINEGSVRDWQSRGRRIARARIFAGAIGLDGDAGRNRRPGCPPDKDFVGGETRQDGGSDMMIFKIRSSFPIFRSSLGLSPATSSPQARPAAAPSRTTPQVAKTWGQHQHQHRTDRHADQPDRGGIMGELG